jgi:hypothetical protein
VTRSPAARSKASFCRAAASRSDSPSGEMAPHRLARSANATSYAQGPSSLGAESSAAARDCWRSRCARRSRSRAQSSRTRRTCANLLEVAPGATFALFCACRPSGWCRGRSGEP